MCNTHTETTLAVCCSLIFHLFTLGLLMTFVILSADLNRIWIQLGEPPFLCMFIAAVSCAIGLLPDIALYVYCYRHLEVLRKSVDLDSEYGSLIDTD